MSNRGRKQYRNTEKACRNGEEGRWSGVDVKVFKTYVQKLHVAMKSFVFNREIKHPSGLYNTDQILAAFLRPLIWDTMTNSIEIILLNFISFSPAKARKTRQFCIGLDLI